MNYFVVFKYFVNDCSLIVNFLRAKKATMKKSCFHNVADSRTETVVKHDLTEDILLQKKIKTNFPLKTLQAPPKYAQ